MLLALMASCLLRCGPTIEPTAHPTHDVERNQEAGEKDRLPRISKDVVILFPISDGFEQM